MHPSFARVSSNASQHSSIGRVSSNASQHSSIGRVSSNASQHSSIGRVNSTTSQHSSLGRVNSNTSQHPSLGRVTTSGPPQLNRVITGSARPKPEGKALKEHHLDVYCSGRGVDVWDVSSDKWVSGTLLQCQAHRNNAAQLIGATVQVQSPLGLQNFELANPGLNPYLRVHQSGHVSQPVHQGGHVKIFSRSADAWKKGVVTGVQQGGEVVEVTFTNANGENFVKPINANDPALISEVSVPNRPALVKTITPHSVWYPPIEKEFEQRFPPKPEVQSLSPTTCSQIGPNTPAFAQQTAMKLQQQVTLQTSSPLASTLAPGGYLNAGPNMAGWRNATSSGQMMDAITADLLAGRSVRGGGGAQMPQMMSMPNVQYPGGLPPAPSMHRTSTGPAGYPGLSTRSMPPNAFTFRAGDNV